MIGKQILTLKIAAIGLILSPVAMAQQEAAQPAPEAELAFPEDVKVNIVDRFGDDECPQSTADEIVVCKVYDESERYRIPSILRNDPNDPDNQSWTGRAFTLRSLGASGTNSCSPGGAGGFTGCTQQLIDQAVAERKGAQSEEYGRLIAEERKKRLELIDAEAEDVERRVLEFEKARAQKEAAEAAAAADATLTVGDESNAPTGELPELIVPEG